MSRNYRMAVIITGDKVDRNDAIMDAAGEEWSFDNWYHHDGKLYGSGDGKLCGGETDDEFADRLAKAVWQANGACCEVEVYAVYLDELPYESYVRTEDDYTRLMKGTPSPV